MSGGGVDAGGIVQRSASVSDGDGRGGGGRRGGGAATPAEVGSPTARGARAGAAARAGALALALAWAGALAGAGAIAAAGLAGCGGSKGAAKKPMSKEEALRKGQLEELKNQHAILEQQIVEFPLNMKAVVALAREHQAKARQLGDAALEAQFQALPDKAKAAFESALETETAKGLDEAKQAIARGDASEAEATLARLASRIEGTPQEARVLDALGDAQVAGRAGKVYERVVEPKLESLGGDERWEMAKGLLESFLLVEAFRAHPKAKEVERALAEIGPKAEAARERRKKEDAIEWAPVFAGKRDELTNFDHSDPDTTSFEDGSFRYRAKSEVARLTIGEDEWADVIVEVVFKVHKGALFFLARGLGGEWQEVARIREYDMSGKDWARIRIEVRGDTATYRVSGGATTSGTAHMENKRGPFQLLLPPNEEAEAEIRSVWVKVLSTREAEPDDEAPEDGGGESGGDGE